jgi:hypothetical protein
VATIAGVVMTVLHGAAPEIAVADRRLQAKNQDTVSA